MQVARGRVVLVAEWGVHKTYTKVYQRISIDYTLLKNFNQEVQRHLVDL
jgi:hypothetical protein